MAKQGDNFLYKPESIIIPFSVKYITEHSLYIFTKPSLWMLIPKIPIIMFIIVLFNSK